MNEEVMKSFETKLMQKTGGKASLRWEVDSKGVVFGWCRLDNQDDIYAVAEIIASYRGRVMTISPLNTPNDVPGTQIARPLKNGGKLSRPIELVINYHFFFEGINLTVSITMPDDKRTVKAITPVLVSADWHEREMRELYKIELQGHPHPVKLFLDESINMTDHTMIPLSEALKGASTSTLWEQVMSCKTKEEDKGE